LKFPFWTDAKNLIKTCFSLFNACGSVSGSRIASFCTLAPRSVHVSSSRLDVEHQDMGKWPLNGSRISSSELLFLEWSVGKARPAGGDKPRRCSVPECGRGPNLSSFSPASDECTCLLS
jgi:hypothetical protein